jgi:O-antigen ligase
MHNKFFQNYFKYSTILLPPLLVTGSFLPDLLVSINSLIFIYFLIKNKIYYLFDNIFFKYFLIFFLYINISSIFSKDLILSFKSTLPYFRFIFFSLLIYYLCMKIEKFKLLFFYSFLITFMILILDGYLQYFSGYNLQGYPITPSSRLGGLFGDEKILGSFLSRNLPLLLFFLFQLKKKSPLFNTYLAFIIISSQVLIFLSGERAAFILTTLSLIYLIILINEYRLIKIIILFLSIIIIFTQILSNNGLKNRMLKITYDNLSESSFFSKIHERYYFTALNIYSNNKIFGSGVKTFRIECKNSKYIENACSTHPHNMYVQLLSETGLIGFIMIFILFIYFIYISVKHFFYLLKKKIFLKNEQICLVASFLITLWPLAPSGNVFNNFISIIYFLPVGFYLSTFLKIKE